MLRILQQHLQDIYRIEAPDVRAFLVADHEVEASLGHPVRDADEWVLVRQGADGDLDLGVYIAEHCLESLAETDSPAEAVEHAFGAFCAATEGISHFLFLVERARRGEPVRLLELEAQAEVDKYLCARLHHPTREREWRVRLFDRALLASDLGSDERDRYREAGRLAAGFCRELGECENPSRLLEVVRLFWRASGAQRMDRMRRLAA